MLNPNKTRLRYQEYVTVVLYLIRILSGSRNYFHFKLRDCVSISHGNHVNSVIQKNAWNAIDISIKYGSLSISIKYGSISIKYGLGL